MTDPFVRKSPCPYCGDKQPSVTRDDGEMYAIFCGICGACGPWKKGLENAIEAWNRRPDGNA